MRQCKAQSVGDGKPCPRTAALLVLLNPSIIVLMECSRHCKFIVFRFLHTRFIFHQLRSQLCETLVLLIDLID